VKNQGVVVMARRAVSLTATMCMVAFGASGCGPALDEGEQQADTAGVTQMVDCCNFGYYRCPDDGMTYDYDPVGCGPTLAGTARALCDANCIATCTNSGWINTCQRAE